MMRPLLLTLLLAGGGWWAALQRIHDANAAQQAGTAAYARHNYAEAAAAFERAQELGSQSAQLWLDLGHAYAHTAQPRQARAAYGHAAQSKDRGIRSVARQQLAVLAAQEGNNAQALTLLRQALIDNPTNAAARYNYELLRPYQGRRTPPQLPPPPPPAGGGSRQQQQPGQADNAAPAPLPAGGGSGGGSRRQPGSGNGTSQDMGQGTDDGTAHGLDPSGEGQGPGSGNAPTAQAASNTDSRVMTRSAQTPGNLSDAQAEQLLNALQASEQQYLQQLPHRSTRRPDPRKPAW